jgi:hypothetical protein
MGTTMRHVDNFEEIILFYFNSIIENFRLELKSNSNEIFDKIILVGSVYRIEFTYDRGETSCAFINVQNGRKYFLNQIYQLLCPRDNEISFSINDTPKEMIAKFSEIFERKLPNLLAGDLSWVDKYDSKY